MCDNFFDVRTFGAVMSTGINCGQVRGPVQSPSRARSSPSCPGKLDHPHGGDHRGRRPSREGDDNDERIENRTMGRKHTVPYGLYVAHGFVSAMLAERTGFSEDDLLPLAGAGEDVRA